MVEQKWQNKNGGTKIIHYSESPKQKLVGTVQVQKGQWNKNWWVEQKKGQRNKNWWVEQKWRNKNWWVEQKKGQQNKNWWAEKKKVSRIKIGEQNKNLAEQKLMGGTKKRSVEQKLVSGTKTVEQKWWNKNYSLFWVTQTEIGGDSASAKRSAQQKLVGTVSHWVTGTPSASAKSSAEQKLQNKKCRTKIGGDSWPLGDGDPKCKCKKVSGTKIAEQKLVSVSAKRSAEQKLWNI